MAGRGIVRKLPFVHQIVLCAVALMMVADNSSARLRNGGEILISLSWGDQITFAPEAKEAPMDTAENVQKFFREYKELGVDAVMFRMDAMRFASDFDWPEPRILRKRNPPYSKQDLWLELEERQWVMTQCVVKLNLIKEFVDIAHENGLKIFAYSSTFDEGMPFDAVRYAKGEHEKPDGGTIVHDYDVYSPIISKFLENHPQCMMVDRSQKKYNWGTLEFAYPEARAYAVGYNRKFLEDYPFDGIFIDFRNEFGHADFGDQFGFAPPIVAEYQKRYGVNILRQQFDVEKWRRLCGEYLTQYIRELYSVVHGKGKTLVVGVPRGNYIGLPNGNMYVDWQGWVKEHIVDGLVVGIMTGQFIYPDRNGYGYMTDEEDGIGLPNILWDLANNYWPLCASHQVKVYTRHWFPSHWYRGPVISLPDLFKTNVDGAFVSHVDRQRLKELR